MLKPALKAAPKAAPKTMPEAMYARAQSDRFTGKPALRVISLGAGVQSSVMALMAAKGELKHKNGKPIKIDYAVFADTGWEPQGVYDHLNWLEKEIQRQPYPFPIERVSVKDIYKRRGTRKKDWQIHKHLLQGKNSTGQDFLTLPVFILNEDFKKSLGRRQCTREYKLDPIRLKIRQLMNVRWRENFPKDKWVEQYIGISYDEMGRMKDSRDVWCKNRWPLAKRKMRRGDCKIWFKLHYPRRVLPRSACIGCPLHSNDEWQDMKANDPKSWANAVKIDKALRRGKRAKKFSGAVYLHNSLKPLDEVDFKCQTSKQRHLAFLEECEGLCGV